MSPRALCWGCLSAWLRVLMDDKCMCCHDRKVVSHVDDTVSRQALLSRCFVGFNWSCSRRASFGRGLGRTFPSIDCEVAQDARRPVNTVHTQTGCYRSAKSTTPPSSLLLLSKSHSIGRIDEQQRRWGRVGDTHTRTGYF